MSALAVIVTATGVGSIALLGSFILLLAGYSVWLAFRIEQLAIRKWQIWALVALFGVQWWAYAWVLHSFGYMR